MGTMGFMDMLKYSYRVLGFKYEQHKLTLSEHVVVKTAKGLVKGIKRKSLWGDTYISFEKIPFAKPPLGPLRFKAPEPAESWDGILDCTSAAEKPLQSNMFFRKYRGSEDCLYLNVFTKSILPEKKRPVMVWIYGGGFQVGEATRDLYSPDFFMSKNIVLVTIAYRLGPFGFLSLEDPQLNIPGNAGIKDQILSLKWVQEHISAFGGDPDNVTLFGESAGGASTHACMITEQSKGLIHKAITMSGSVLCPWTRSPKSRLAYRLAVELGYKGEDKDKDVYEFLLDAKGSDMVIANPKVLSKEEKHRRFYLSFGPIVEPYITEQCIIPEEPDILMKKAWSNNIPLMMGATSFEGLLFYPEITRRPATLNEVGNCANLLPYDIQLTAGSQEKEDFGLQLKKTYFGDEECNVQNKMKFLELLSYREFLHPLYRTALSRLQYGQGPTYFYRFNFDSKDNNIVRHIMCGSELRGVCHGDEVFFMFHNMLTNRFHNGSSEQHLIMLLIDIWTSFAEKGDPNCAMLEGVKFEPITNIEDFKCLNISEKCEFIELPELPKLKVWNSFYPVGKL